MFRWILDPVVAPGRMLQARERSIQIGDPVTGRHEPCPGAGS